MTLLSYIGFATGFAGLIGIAVTIISVLRTLKSGDPDVDPRATIRRILPLHIVSVVVAFAGIAIVVASLFT